MQKYFGPKKLSSVVEKVTQPAIKEQGYLLFKLTSYWHVIVGQKLAEICFPIKLNFPPQSSKDGILYLEINNPGFGLEIQANEASIIERISGYIGYQAIARIKLIISVKKREQKRQSPAIQENINNESINSTIENIEDAEIRNILENIAKQIF
ncbi:hypothetical protein RFI_19360 [Reticulomyxa filosa]|uniref:DUF721 domain-containing protein n=1 Tax=Reticulomyxa filosa TaxID=46433 RepID=X6MWE5_RETFI|nr:hypothetical protein RFI_19360 [Reticulomyxa filosa]|eukprot:ETO17946.1 hypothetical protein RFI_19360 [Reticulomyxa filosa]